MDVNKLLMNREQFPCTYTGYGDRSYFSGNLMIPPIHESIVEKVIDMNTAFSVAKEAMENSYQDIIEAASRRVYLRIDPDDMKLLLENWEKMCFHGDDYVSFGASGTPRLMIEKNTTISFIIQLYPKVPGSTFFSKPS